MLKRMSIKKIIISGSALFALFLIYLIPKDNNNLLDNAKQELTYAQTNVVTSPIFLLDDNDFLARTNVVVNSDASIEKKAKELLDILIKDGSGDSQIPSGFKAIIPSDTQVLSVKYEENILKVNFSKDLLDVSLDQEEKVIEAIVYTLTSIPDVKNVMIYVDGNLLTKLPQTNIILPSVLNRKFGINKIYDIDSLKSINSVTIYYIKEKNNNYYYVPVTRYVNDDRDKIKIIIENLASSSTYNTNLMSFLNSNAELLTAQKTDDVMQLNFNKYIFQDADTKKILEEVTHTICLSVYDNYDVKEIIFNVDDKPVYQNTLKSS